MPKDIPEWFYDCPRYCKPNANSAASATHIRRRRKKGSGNGENRELLLNPNQQRDTPQHDTPERNSQLPERNNVQSERENLPPEPPNPNPNGKRLLSEMQPLLPSKQSSCLSMLFAQRRSDYSPECSIASS
ncbi:hypothetical protein BT96DRAFT_993396 [Gymnopus androsaceus JB14]|uniref:Uncharacterized protein n=1 Tax=Gymnopus androsaceus JB14 TaxID=1447944 RepID=A0A6A4HSY8_9AGAR|nr:hypothetical protein BT96DRAFT_993396 [Gymnopus androsaceus JB14]